MIQEVDKICSGCGKVNDTVSRYRFDGMCAECTTKALFDTEFAEKAKLNNQQMLEKL